MKSNDGSFIKRVLSRIKFLKYVVPLIVIVIVLFWGNNIFKTTSTLHSYNNNALADRVLDSLLIYDFKVADNQIKKLIRDAVDTKDPEKFARANYFKMAISIKKYNLDSIPSYYKYITDYVSKFDDGYLEARANLLLGVYYMSTNDNIESFELFQKGETYFKKHNDFYNLANVHNNLGGVYYAIGDSERALELYRGAEEYFNSQGNYLRSLMISTNKASKYIDGGKIDEAKVVLLEAYDELNKRNDTINVIRVLYLLSHASLKEKELNNAFDYLDRASDLSKSTNTIIFQSLTLSQYGRLYDYLGDYEKAINFYKKGYDLSVNKAMNLERLKDLSNTYKKTGMCDEALSYLNQYYHLRDSIDGTNVKLKLEEIGLNNVLEETREEHRIENEAQKKMRFIYVISILCILILSLFIWLLYRNNRKRLHISILKNKHLEEKVEAKKELQKLMSSQHQMELESRIASQELQNKLYEVKNESLEFERRAQQEIQLLQEKQHEIEFSFKNRELNRINLQLISKSQMLNKIEELLQQFPDKKTKLFKELRDSIKESRNQSRDWEQFKELFQKIHPDFFTYLQKNYPDLTKSEIRICAYIKINMDNNNVAHLLNISYQSLMTNRYKIRKKLKLIDRNDDLDSFIQSI